MHCIAQRDLHNDMICRCGLDEAIRRDTEHLLSSPENARRLREAIKGPFHLRELYDSYATPVTDEEAALLARLK
jgi:hypothetical protein